MGYVATKPFNSAVRRFAVGDNIEDGAELLPHTIESLKLANLIDDGDVPKSQSAEPASD